MQHHGHLPINRSQMVRAALAIILVLSGLGLFWWRSAILDLLDHHEGTAAWVQAIGAVLIIYATARIANRNSREAQLRECRAKRQLWESIAVLAGNRESAIDTLLEKYPSSVTFDPRGCFLRAYTPSDFDVPMDGLAAIPLHQIGDTTLSTAVLTLRGVMGRIKKHLDDVLRDQVLSQTLEPVRNQRTQASNAVASVLRIVEGNAAEEKISRLASHL
jgi:hypothetical protein